MHAQPAHSLTSKRFRTDSSPWIIELNVLLAAKTFVLHVARGGTTTMDRYTVILVVANLSFHEQYSCYTTEYLAMLYGVPF